MNIQRIDMGRNRVIEGEEYRILLECLRRNEEDHG